MYIDKTLYTTAPSAEGRLEKEMRVYELLDQLQISYTRIDHEHADTIEDCAAIETLLGAQICKNLFLRNRQATNFYLLLMPGDKRFLTKELSKQLSISRLSFAEPEYMEQYLNTTPGSASILGLMNDPEHHVQLVIDEDLLKQDVIGCHPCINTSSLNLKTVDILEKFLPHTGHSYAVVPLTGEA